MTNVASTAGTRVENPITEGPAYWAGSLEFVTLKLTGKETDGAFALVELVALPGAEPPPHIHHTTDETYYILDGELDVLDEDRTYTARTGAVVFLPRGRVHAWRNATERPTRALLLITPAGFEGIIPEVGVPGTLSSPPAPSPPPSAEDSQRLHELGQKYATEYPAGITW